MGLLNGMCDFRPKRAAFQHFIFYDNVFSPIQHPSVHSSRKHSKKAVWVNCVEEYPKRVYLLSNCFRAEHHALTAVHSLMNICCWVPRLIHWSVCTCRVTDARLPNPFFPFPKHSAAVRQRFFVCSRPQLKSNCPSANDFLRHSGVWLSWFYKFGFPFLSQHIYLSFSRVLTNECKCGVKCRVGSDKYANQLSAQKLVF